MKSYTLAIGIIFSALFLPGCALPPPNKAMLSSHVGCAPQQISISNDQTHVLSNARSYQVKCHHKTFYCSTVYGGENSTAITSCTKKIG